MAICLTIEKIILLEGIIHANTSTQTPPPLITQHIHSIESLVKMGNSMKHVLLRGERTFFIYASSCFLLAISRYKVEIANLHVIDYDYVLTLQDLEQANGSSGYDVL
jgi:hypothetical protein